jgi:energy-coupling factor transporter ATPase
MGMSAISVQNLSLSFPAAHGIASILSNVSFAIAAGEFVALMGPNGSGKTSLARCLNGILQPSAGTVLVDGCDTRDVDRLLEVRRRVGLVFQHPDNQMVAPTVEREIAFGLENLGMPREEMHRRVEAMLERFELRRYREHAPHQLSGGEKQRVALASIMAMSPRYLILDEPTSLLDYASRVRLFETLAELRRDDEAITILLITQFSEEALFAERLLVLDEGRLVMEGSPVELFQRIEDFQKIGLQPPLEFLLYHEYSQNGSAALRLEDFMLEPVL